jgi:hypothetical protein
MSQQHSPRVRLPVIPDLRFESSYLRSITPYIHLPKDDVHPTDEKSKGKGKAVDAAVPSDDQQQLARIEWGRVAWVTTRDQVISPLLQGAIWCVNPIHSSFLFILKIFKGGRILLYNSFDIPYQVKTTNTTSITWSWGRIGSRSAKELDTWASVRCWRG